MANLKPKPHAASSLMDRALLLATRLMNTLMDNPRKLRPLALALALVNLLIGVFFVIGVIATILWFLH